ncbi:hypothetical protein J6590_019671 [Homalodisca vitripennis]|nr:hypothetical protein J6590_019671 [Homalodisca vitripennis]
MLMGVTNKEANLLTKTPAYNVVETSWACELPALWLNGRNSSRELGDLGLSAIILRVPLHHQARHLTLYPYKLKCDILSTQ